MAGACIAASRPLLDLWSACVGRLTNEEDLLELLRLRQSMELVALRLSFTWPQGRIQDLVLGARSSAERKNRGAAGAEGIWGRVCEGCPPPHWEFSFLGFEVRISQRRWSFCRKGH